MNTLKRYILACDDNCQVALAASTAVSTPLRGPCMPDVLGSVGGEALAVAPLLMKEACHHVQMQLIKLVAVPVLEVRHSGEHALVLARAMHLHQHQLR